MILATAAVFALNRAVWLGRPWARWFPRFWLAQAMNLTMTCLLILVGIPDFQGGAHVISLVLAGLVVFHSVRNNKRFAEERRRLTEEEDPELEERKQAIRALIRDDDEE